MVSLANKGTMLLIILIRTRCVLLEDGYIEVHVDKIHLMTGLQNGGQDLYYVKTCSNEGPIYTCRNSEYKIKKMKSVIFGITS